jgi:type IV pilus assembly protein PilX
MNKIKQQGAVLFISLIILVLLTILGLSSMKGTVLQEKMTGNFKNKSKSFQATETALRAGENWLKAQAGLPSIDSQNLYTKGGVDALNNDWWWPNGQDVDAANNGTAVSVSGVSKQPRFAVEQEAFSPDSLNVGVGAPSGSYVHRVSAYGIGGNDSAPSALESRFMKRYNE